MPGIKAPVLLPIRNSAPKLRSGLFPYAPPRASVVAPVNGVYVVVPRPTPRAVPVPPTQPQQLSAAQAPQYAQRAVPAVARNPWANAVTETRGFNWVGGPLPFMNVPILATKRFMTWQPPLIAPQRRWWLV